MRFQFEYGIFTSDDDKALYSMDVGSAIHIQC